MRVSFKALVALSITLTATGFAGLSPQVHATASKSRKTVIPHFRHVFVIVMENHSYHDLMNENDVPYLHHLARQYGLATEYYGVTNPSVGDRVALLSGTTSGTELPHSGSTGLTQQNIIDQLSAHHLSWGAFYQHSRLSTSANPTYRYQEGHSTYLRFQDIANSPGRISHFHPLRGLSTALASNNVPNFVWLSPNSMSNMEGGYRSPGQFTFQGAGPGGATSADSSLERGGNNFLKTWIPRITGSKAWHHGHNAIFIAFDETSYDASMPTSGYWLSHTGVAGSPVIPAGTNLSGNSRFLFPGGVDGGGHSLSLVITNHPHHVVSSTPYNEYSILKTIEASWHLGYLGHAASSGVHAMSAFFGRPTKIHKTPDVKVGTMAGYDTYLKNTPVVAKGITPQFHSSTSAADISTTSTPYFAQGVANQIGSTVKIKENNIGVLSGSLTVTLMSPSSKSGVHFSLSSDPVASTQVANPSSQAVQFAPSSVSSSMVRIPVVTSGNVPATGIITGLALRVSPNAKSGSVVATVASHGKVLGTVTLGTVGKPRPGLVPEMMAPVVLNHRMAFPFVEPVTRSKKKKKNTVRVRIEGQYPTSKTNDSNQYATFTTKTNVPVVSDSAALLTSQAGKQYWVDARQHKNRTWSSALTFSVSRKK